MNLVTPREPASRALGTSQRFPATQQTRRVTRWSHIVAAAASSASEHHAVNEDSHSRLDGAAPIFVVADGVGGGAMAAWASRHLVNRLHRSLERRPVDAEALREALLAADRDVGRSIARRTSQSGAATVALCAGTGAFLSRWYVGWVGDCRAYRVGASPAQAPLLLTRDDTYRNLGEGPPPGGSPDDPARMVGNGAVSQPNVACVGLRAGEALLLCSDGVHKHVSADEMAHAVRAASPLAERCLRILQAARARGSVDDATVLIVRREAPPRAALWRYASMAMLVVLLSGAVFGLASRLDRESSSMHVPMSSSASHSPSERQP